MLGEKQKLLKVRSDFIFRLIFGDQRNTDILAEFLKSMLDIPPDEYDKLTIVDPYLKKETVDDKFAILDVKLHTKSGMVVSIEIQVEPLPDMKQRVVYGQSKAVTEQIKSGDKWGVISKVVTIVITDFALIRGDDRYHHEFRSRTKDGIEFSDITEIHTLELCKLPPDADNTDLWNWSRFIRNSENDEEALNMLAEKSPGLKKAVGVLKELSEDERIRMINENREIAWRDYMSRMDGAERKGIEKGIEAVAKNLLNMNRPVEEIVEATGLSKEQILNLG